MANDRMPVLVMDDENDSTICAWCPSEEYTDEAKQGQVSHGICKGHALVQRMRRQVGKVPSAVSEGAAEQRRRSLFQW